MVSKNSSNPARQGPRRDATAIIAISRKGGQLASALEKSLGPSADLYVQRRFAAGIGPGATLFELPLRPVVEKAFRQYQCLVLFMPVGVAVRLLAPCLKDKHSDPAVVCIDDAARFVVSLLSGHVGGADRLAQQLAEALSAVPVVTSASHVTGTLAVDLLGCELGWTLEAPSAIITRASAAMVNGEPVALLQEVGERDWWPPEEPLPGNIRIYPTIESLMTHPWAVALIITDRALLPYSQLGEQTVVIYRPRTLVVGMGCRKGVPTRELEELLTSTFESYGLSLSSLRCIATAEIKRNEPAIRDLGDKLAVPVRYYGDAQLNSHPGPSGPSAAQRLLGVSGVCEPAALAASGSRSLLVTKQTSRRATIAVARNEELGGHG